MATIVELRDQARAAGIKGFMAMDKAELEAALSATVAGSPSPSSSPPPVSPPTSGSTVPRASAPSDASVRIPCGLCHGEGVPVMGGGYLCSNCGREWEVTDGD